jgi:hypothetical protein
VSGPLSVDLNRRQLHDLDAPSRFETEGSFSITLRNHGEGVHVHVQLDDSLSRVATLADNNYYVEADGTMTVPVSVDAPPQPIRGRLRVQSGYGSETADVEVAVTPPDETGPPVDVDESLGRPPGASDGDGDDAPPLGDRLRGIVPSPDASTVGLLVLVVAAVGLALVVGSTIDSLAVQVGVGVVICGAIAALLFALK